MSAAMAKARALEARVANDSKWKSAMMLVQGAPELATDDRVLRHVDPIAGEIRWDRILGSPHLSRENQVQLGAAASLFAGIPIDLSSIACHLGAEALELVISAIRTRCRK